MPQKFDNSFKLNETQLEQLKQIIPEAFKDGFVDIGALSDALSDYSGDDVLDEDEHLFGLYWPGKKAARKMAQTKPKGSLVPVPGDGVDEDTTRNIYIEGDNLEVLKLLQKSYAGKIKMIYIDPPYNTGSDFIYDDNFTETVEEFQKRIGIVNAEGVKQTTNNKADGRFHSKWLSMMYPRLRLARDLLSDDGVIFISIDDNEVAQLRKICDEIFGDENFRNSIFTRRYDKNINRQFIEEGLSTMNTGLEYILMYSKDANAKFNPVFRKSSEERANTGYWKGFWNDANRPTMRYDILGFTPESGQWKWGKELAFEAVNNYIEYTNKHSSMSIEEYWASTGKNKKFIRRKEISKGKNSGVEHWIPPSEGILRNTNWSDLLASKPIEVDIPFNSPKNSNVIIELIKLSDADNVDVILDFFSGSATTAHSVMQLNAEDGGNRQFIMVQLKEEVTQKSFKEAFDFLSKEKKPLNICEIGKERIRRAGKKIREQIKSSSPQLDIGFKVFRLSQSNFKPVEPYTGSDIKELPDWFSGDPLIEGWKPENLLTEVMLKEGFPLDSKIITLDMHKKNKIYEVSHEFCGHSLVICLDPNIDNETISKLDLGESNIFICLDSAITDQAKARLDDKKGRLVTI
ncbi:MAG: site-specific DNA-methyltransferase [Treponema sp.]|nr:site-specific DNA-methyltransferase [Treponema sp.]